MAAIADPAEVADPAYAEGLRRALRVAIEFGLETIDSGEGHDPPIPVELLGQARLAARNGVALDTVLRRYFAGYSLLGFYVTEEAGRGELMSGAELQRLTALQASRFDRLVEAVGEEYARECEALVLSSRESRQSKRIVRLLEGELIDTTEIAYDFKGWHLGMVVAGPDAEEAPLSLLKSRDCRVLHVRRGEAVTWIWLGTRQGPGALDPDCLRALTPGSALAAGEPGQGLEGWRRTHRQAAAALPLAQRPGNGQIVHYADVAMLASITQDDLLATWLRQTYIVPIETAHDGGQAVRKALQAYLACGCNRSSAAARLGVGRNTVARRLQRAEDLIGRPIDSSIAELSVALRM